MIHNTTGYAERTTVDLPLICALVAAVAAAVAAVAALACLATVRRIAVQAENDRTAAEARAQELTHHAQETQRALDSAQQSLGALVQHAAATTPLMQQRFDTVSQQIARTGDQMDALRRETTQQLGQNRENLEGRLDQVRETVDRQLGQMRTTVDRQLGDIRTDNARQLDQVRATVDEKLSRTLNDRLSASFKQVSDQLEAVYKGLGDMQSIASGVGDLKRVLSNVKTRGMLGEVQLGAILSDILAPEQYLENVATKPGSSERVEFAVKLPVESGDPILLPIDAKFPGDTYEHLRDALDDGDAESIAAARRALETRIKGEAKEISSKYLSVPETTNFAIMFLPFEGLYAEVVDRPGLVEVLQRDYHVNVAGPSTMAALLNSLQMSYQTFRLQKRTDDVLRVLAAVKAELPNYQEALRRARKQIDTAGRTVDSIITTRTNVIERKLNDISALADDDAAEVLGIEASIEHGDSYAKALDESAILEPIHSNTEAIGATDRNERGDDATS